LLQQRRRQEHYIVAALAQEWEVQEHNRQALV
jgi:hypothetical protein